MINLKTEEFVLDGPPLQSLQQLIQWVGDFVLYLLANLPNQVSSGQVLGVPAGQQNWSGRQSGPCGVVPVCPDPPWNHVILTRCPLSCRVPWCGQALASCVTEHLWGC